MLGIPGPGRVAPAAANFDDAPSAAVWPTCFEFSDRSLGLEHRFDEVIPEAIRATSADAGGHVGDLVPNAASVEPATAPGGHLGVLTGRPARETTGKLLDGHLDR